MKNTNCKWLPETVSLNDYNGDFGAYFKYLYKVFDNDLIKNPPLFKGEKVKVRWTPMHENKPEAFYHLTHKDYMHTGYETRLFDTKRSERLHWVKPTIQNYGCNNTCCSHIKYWTEKKGKTIFILFEDEYYIIILNKRKDYYLLVTAYYIETEHRRNLIHKQYERAIKAKDV